MKVIFYFILKFPIKISKNNRKRIQILKAKSKMKKMKKNFEKTNCQKKKFEKRISK